MRSLATKTLAVILAAVMALAFLAPVASAQNGYAPPPVGPTSSTTGDEDLATINANNAARAAADAAKEAAVKAAAGDGAGATAAAAKAQAYADKAAQILKDGKAAGFQASVIARLEAASNAAAASAAAASASAKAVASVPLAVSVPVPNLAFTGSTASLPAALGATLVGAGGLALLFARKRELAQG